MFAFSLECANFVIELGALILESKTVTLLVLLQLLQLLTALLAKLFNFFLIFGPLLFHFGLQVLLQGQGDRIIGLDRLAPALEQARRHLACAQQVAELRQVGAQPRQGDAPVIARGELHAGGDLLDRSDGDEQTGHQDQRRHAQRRQQEPCDVLVGLVMVLAF